MKALLKFDLDDPDDKMAHMRCVKATDMAIAIFEIQNNLRRQVEDYPDVDTTTVDIIFTFINQELDERNININELIV